MKTLTFVFAALLLNCSAYSQSGLTWSSAVSVANSNLGNYHPRISSGNNGDAYIIWGNGNDSRVFFSKWSGTSFSTPKAISPTSIAAATWMGPDLASKGDTVYVTFKKTPENLG